jgi:hypothetical protein
MFLQSYDPVTPISSDWLDNSFIEAQVASEMRPPLLRSGIFLIWLVIALLGTSSELCQGQDFVYSINGKSYEHFWYFELPPSYAFGTSSRFGLQQYSLSRDTNGQVIINLGSDISKVGVRHTYTEILIGTKTCTVPLPAFTVAGIGAIALVVLGWFAMHLLFWATHRRNKPSPPPPAVP